MWQGEWNEGRPWKVGSLTCPSSAKPQSQPAIWTAVGARPLSADSSIQPLSPNFVFQQTPAAAAAATIRGTIFPLKTPMLPLSGDSSMMAAEKQRSAFSSRPERRDVAALLIAGARQASLIDSASLGSRNSPCLHQRRQQLLEADSNENISAQAPILPTSSNPTSKVKALFKGRSEEKFRLLANDSSLETKSESSAFAYVSSSKRFHQRVLDAADAAQAALQATTATGTKQQAASSSLRASSAAKIATGKTSKKSLQRDIVEAWV